MKEKPKSKKKKSDLNERAFEIVKKVTEKDSGKHFPKKKK